MRKKAAVAVVVILCLATVGVLATNYADLFRDVDDTTRYVPADADGVVRVNATSVDADGETARFVESATGMGGTELLRVFRNRTGLDPGGLREATVFVDRNGSTEVGVIFRADWKPDTVRDEARRFSLERSRHNLVPFYTVEPNISTPASDVETRFYVTAVARNVYVAGTEGAVRAASDVSWADAPRLDEDLRDRLDDAPVAFVVPGGSTSLPVSEASGAYRTGSGTVDLTLELRPSEDADVDQLRRTVGTYTDVARALDTVPSETLDAVDVSVTNSSVVVRYETSVEEAARRFRGLDRRYGWSDRLGAYLNTVGVDVSVTNGTRLSQQDRRDEREEQRRADHGVDRKERLSDIVFGDEMLVDE